MIISACMLITILCKIYALTLFQFILNLYLVSDTLLMFLWPTINLVDSGLIPAMDILAVMSLKINAQTLCANHSEHALVT